LDQLLKAAAGLPFWVECPVESTDGIIKGVIFTRNGDCHWVRISDEADENRSILTANVWGLRLRRPDLSWNVLLIHAGTRHARIVPGYPEELVIAMASISYGPEGRASKKYVRQVFCDLHKALEVLSEMRNRGKTQEPVVVLASQHRDEYRLSKGA
jgi:hypothetical protein